MDEGCSRHGRWEMHTHYLPRSLKERRKSDIQIDRRCAEGWWIHLLRIGITAWPLLTQQWPLGFHSKATNVLTTSTTIYIVKRIPLNEIIRIVIKISTQWDPKTWRLLLLWVLSNLPETESFNAPSGNMYLCVITIHRHTWRFLLRWRMSGFTP